MNRTMWMFGLGILWGDHESQRMCEINTYASLWKRITAHTTWTRAWNYTLLDLSRVSGSLPYFQKHRLSVCGETGWFHCDWYLSLWLTNKENGNKENFGLHVRYPWFGQRQFCLSLCSALLYIQFYHAAFWVKSGNF